MRIQQQSIQAVDERGRRRLFCCQIPSTAISPFLDWDPKLKRTAMKSLRLSTLVCAIHSLNIC